MDPIMFHAPSCAANAASLVPPTPIGFGDDEVPLFSCECQSEEISPEDEYNDDNTPLPDRNSADVSQSGPSDGAAPATTGIIPTDVTPSAVAAPVADRYPPLNEALADEDWAGALALIAEGADLAAMDSIGMTPLHWACAFGRVDVVNAILSRVADDGALKRVINQPEDNGTRTALHTAICGGHPECALALIAAGCDLEARCFDWPFYGYSALHLACRYCLADVVSALVLRGANVWAEGPLAGPRAGYSPLECAIAERHSDCVGILVDAMERNKECGQRRSCPACNEGTYSPLGLAVHHMMECPSPPRRVRKWVCCKLCRGDFKGAVGLALHELRSGDCGKTLSLPAPSKVTFAAH